MDNLLVHTNLSCPTAGHKMFNLLQPATYTYVHLQNDRDRFSNCFCWLLYHMWIVATYHELLQLRMGCFTGRKKSHFILHVPCFRLFSPSPVATDKTVGTRWDWIALLQILTEIEENPYYLNGLTPSRCIFFTNTRAQAFRMLCLFHKKTDTR